MNRNNKKNKKWKREKKNFFFINHKLRNLNFLKTIALPDF